MYVVVHVRVRFIPDASIITVVTLVAEAGSNGRKTCQYSEAILHWRCY